MNVNELMIGDLVRVNKDVCIKKDTIVKVRGIDADNNMPKLGLRGSTTCVQVDDRCVSGGIWAEYLEPIPITPEILDKNGFETVGDYYDIPNDPSLVIKVVSNTFVFGHSINGYFEGFIALDYVHELQHALKLCGIEKEIVL